MFVCSLSYFGYSRKRCLEMRSAGGLVLLCLPLLVILVPGCLKGTDEDPGSDAVKASRSGVGKPNIMLITLESLRADHVGCYGYDRATTPSLDALASEGTVFENAYSVTSWTLTSHASIFTGLYPTAHKVIKPIDRLDDSYTTIAEHLQKQGYQTAGVISGPFLRRTHNLHQGFTFYDESAASEVNRLAHGDITNPRMEELLVQFLEKQRSSSQPFFLFAYFWDPHYDYIPPPPYDTMFIPQDAEKIDILRFERWNMGPKVISSPQMAYVLSQYDGEIRCTDDLLGRLWRKLHDLNLWDNTTIIVTADHGEEFYEHHRWGHKNHLYNETLHVPLVIKPAGKTKPKRDERLVNLIDLYPTILETAKATPTQPHHGRSLWASPPSKPITSFYELVSTFYLTAPSGEVRPSAHQWYAVREEGFKLITRYSRDGWRFFDLVVDPDEQTPVGSQYGSKMSELRAKIEDFRVRMQKVAQEWSSSPPAELTHEELERLRSLGYIGGGDE